MYKASMTDEDVAKQFRKDYAAGQYSHLSKADYHALIQDIARDMQGPLETKARADARIIEKTETGRALFKAYKSAPATTSRLAEKHVYIKEIQRRADAKFSELKSPQQRFARAIDVDKHNRPYDDVSRILYETSKRAPGLSVAPSRPEPVGKMDSTLRGPAHARMHSLAIDEQRKPGNTYARAYANVYGAPENQDLFHPDFFERERRKSKNATMKSS